MEVMEAPPTLGDVYFGRKYKNKPGNVRCRELVWMSAARYRNAKGDIAKGKIVQETIGMLNQERRRFVIEIEGVWYLAGRDRIHRKVCQIFTETSTKPEVVAEAEQLKRQAPQEPESKKLPPRGQNPVSQRPLRCRNPRLVSWKRRAKETTVSDRIRKLSWYRTKAGRLNEPTVHAGKSGFVQTKESVAKTSSSHVWASPTSVGSHPSIRPGMSSPEKHPLQNEEADVERLYIPELDHNVSSENQALDPLFPIIFGDDIEQEFVALFLGNQASLGSSPTAADRDIVRPMSPLSLSTAELADVPTVRTLQGEPFSFI